MTIPVCDFCLSPDVKWTHPPKDDTPETQLVGATNDPILPITHIFNSSPWVACPSCSNLVVGNDIPGLATRAAKKGLMRMGLTPSKAEVKSYAAELTAKYTELLPALAARISRITKTTKGGSLSSRASR